MNIKHKLILFLLLIFFGLITPSKADAQVNPLSGIHHVFVILMENHDWSAISASAAPYINNTLLPLGAHANNYHNIPTSLGSLHPSEPNYLFLEGGTNTYPDFTFTNDNNASSSNSTSSTAHLATLLNNTGLIWKAYQENVPSGCPINSSGQYAAKHNPFVFFKDVSGSPPSTANSYCSSHTSNLTTTILQNDLNSGNIGNYNFLTPNLCNDMHDCSVATGDNWLKTYIPIIMNSNLYKQDGAIFITWDEGGSGNNPIGMIMLSPFAKPGFSNNIEYSHASTVKTIENIFNLRPYVGHAADVSVQDLSAFFGTNSSTPIPTPTSTPIPTSTPKPSPTPIKTATPTPTSTPTVLPGDANNDNKVDGLDYVIWLNHYNQTISGVNNGNFNSDSKVDGLDYVIWVNNYGKTNGQTPTPSPIAGIIDSSTIDHKFMLGYQGWHQTPCDGSPSPAWRHWFGGTPPNSPLIDAWPDVSELTSAERCDTGLKFQNGQVAYLFSDYNQQTVVRHFQWMQQNGIDGVMLQRFTSELSNSSMFAERNKVTQNVQAGAEQTGRVFNIMYDISGQNVSTLVSTIENDWKYLVDTLKITSSSRYLKQNNKPVVVLWGFGFSDRPGTPNDLTALLDFFHNNTNPAYRATVIGGVNNDWRTNATWAQSLTGFDIISPWMVGRVNSLASADSYKSITSAELSYANTHNQLYMPVIFPGFSFYNQSGSALNQIPRLGGNFIWRQAYNDLSAGATMLYGAMFDEVNEGTALFKQSITSDNWPIGLNMVPLNTDGYSQLPNDWYLKVAGEITKMVKGIIPISTTMSITPH